MQLEDKYTGVALAIVGNMGIGTSFVITKKGLMQAEKEHGFEGDGFVYLKSPLWWIGIAALALGEACNFAAYAFAPAILVTPLGALAVLVGAVLGSYVLGEILGILGKLGSALCLMGAGIIVLHAPPDKDIQTTDEILHFAIQPGFLIYATVVTVYAVVAIYRIAPKYGKTNPMYYLSICSLVGSVSVMAIKAFGIALKLTFAGNNQFTHPSTYVFMIITTVCMLVQLNYFNKALSQFPTNIVNPLYYVTFTTATLCASSILFSGFNTTDAVGTLSLLSGFLVTFTGVYLLNLSRTDPNGTRMSTRSGAADAIGTDMVSSIQTRMSMEARRSFGPSGHRRSISGQDRQGLIRAYDEEEAGFGLTDLTEDSDDGDERSPMHPNGTTNGNGKISREMSSERPRPGQS